MTPETLHQLAHWLLRLLCRVEIEGQENVPQVGPAILVANHLGLFDPLLGYAVVGRLDVTGWVADKHKKNPLYRYFVNQAGGVWLDREHPDPQALRKALRTLKEGHLFGLAPEGTRSPTGAMIRAKEGASYLALASGVPLLPVGIIGTEKAAKEWKHLRRPRIKVRIGKLFHLPTMEGLSRQEAMARATDEIMCRIAALLPPNYRGVYADHPRLKELLGVLPLDNPIQ